MNVRTSCGPSASTRHVSASSASSAAPRSAGRRVPACASSSRYASPATGSGGVEPPLDPVEPGDQQRGDDQVRARGAVGGAHLDPRSRAALVRHAHERGAVVVPPVRVGRCEAVREDPLVRVDRRPEQRLQRRRVLDHTGDELRGERAQPVRPAVRRRTRCGRRSPASERWTWNPEPPWSANGRPMKVATSPSERGHLLHGGLEHERAVGGVDRGRVLDVDLVLRVHELVVGGEGLSPSSSPQSSIRSVIWRGSEIAPTV